ncbi:hypothetical protein H2200_007970 [Cladophialophora chaetospira]|uniref:Uncharacterized protein n=1 Tax=Cladophialophora chaetospira TaxID=386627 RepID=A0AA38X775_9EURO|nr:hypothetical protein H2200_007970 [Cladophialophora chaetospira]
MDPIEYDLHGVGSDAESVSSSQGEHTANGSSSLNSRSGPTSESNAAAAETILGLTDDFMGLIKKLYTIADNKYTEELQDVPMAGIDFDVADCLDNAPSLNNVTAAKKRLKDLQQRLKIAKSQEVLAENRLKLAQAQIAAIEDQIEAQTDAVEDALRGK